MRRLVSRRSVVAAAMVVAVVAGGAALADSGTGSQPSSFVDALARHLGISTQTLQDAAKQAALDQVDAALGAGRITQEQADAQKARINSGQYPLSGQGFGQRPPGRGPFGRNAGPGRGFGLGGYLQTAAAYLGLAEQDLIQKLRDGQSLAQIATAQSKSTDGLEQAIVAAAKTQLDNAVAANRITAGQEKTILDRLQTTVDRIVNGPQPSRQQWAPGSGNGTPFRQRWFGAPVKPSARLAPAGVSS